MPTTSIIYLAYICIIFHLKLIIDHWFIPTTDDGSAGLIMGTRFTNEIAASFNRAAWLATFWETKEEESDGVDKIFQIVFWNTHDFCSLFDKWKDE